MKFGTVFPGANVELIDKTTEVAPGITLIALISDAPGTKELKELSLAIKPKAEKVDTTAKQLLLYLLGPILGALIAFSFSLAAETMDHTIRTPVEVEKYLGKPVLAVLPKMQAPGGGRRRLRGATKPSIAS